MIRVLVVDDSPFMRRAITRILSSASDIEVVGTAGSGREAIEAIPVLRPDVMTLDVVMPGEDGVTVLDRVMQVSPLPTLMLSSVTTENAEYTLAALEAGAVDFVTKPSGFTHMDMPRIAQELLEKVRTAASVDVGALRGERRRPSRPAETEPLGPCHDGPVLDGLIVGCSTGGPAALKTLLRALPAHLERPVLVIQHMPVGFTAALAARLDMLARVPVREVRDGDLFEGGRVLIGKAGLHVHVGRKNGKCVLALEKEPAGTPHTPSVNVAMKSAAETLGASAMGVLLTGMGTDGAEGLRALRDAGAYTMAEAESSAVVWGMPRAAIERGAACEVATLDAITETVVRRLAGGRGACGG